VSALKLFHRSSGMKPRRSSRSNPPWPFVLEGSTRGDWFHEVRFAVLRVRRPKRDHSGAIQPSSLWQEDYRHLGGSPALHVDSLQILLRSICDDSSALEAAGRSRESENYCLSYAGRVSRHQQTAASRARPDAHPREVPGLVEGSRRWGPARPPGSAKGRQLLLGEGVITECGPQTR
jgi:hypothetical protein